MSKPAAGPDRFPVRRRKQRPVLRMLTPDAALRLELPDILPLCILLMVRSVSVQCYNVSFLNKCWRYVIWATLSRENCTFEPYSSNTTVGPIKTKEFEKTYLKKVRDQGISNVKGWSPRVKACLRSSVYTSALRVRLKKALERAVPVLSRAGRKLIIWKRRTMGSRTCLEWPGRRLPEKLAHQTACLSMNPFCTALILDK